MCARRRTYVRTHNLRVQLDRVCERVLFLRDFSSARRSDGRVAARRALNERRLREKRKHATLSLATSPRLNSNYRFVSSSLSPDITRKRYCLTLKYVYFF